MNIEENTTSKKSHTAAENATNNSTSGNESTYTMDFNREPIEGTPFVKLWSKEHGFALGIAEHRVTGWYKTEEELTKKRKGVTTKGIDWDLMTGVIMILIEKIDQKKQLDNAIAAKESTKEN